MDVSNWTNMCDKHICKYCSARSGTYNNIKHIETHIGMLKEQLRTLTESYPWLNDITSDNINILKTLKMLVLNNDININLINTIETYIDAGKNLVDNERSLRKARGGNFLST
jgi:hypothetical protein